MAITSPLGSLADVRRSLYKMIQDLELVQQNGAPPHSELTHAPLLRDWSPSHLWMPAASGEVVGHPLLGSKRRIRTSIIVAIDPQEGWLRTWSRFYRLDGSTGFHSTN